MIKQKLKIESKSIYLFRYNLAGFSQLKDIAMESLILFCFNNYEELILCINCSL